MARQPQFGDGRPNGNRADLVFASVSSAEQSYLASPDCAVVPVPWELDSFGPPFGRLAGRMPAQGAQSRDKRVFYAGGNSDVSKQNPEAADGVAACNGYHSIPVHGQGSQAWYPRAAMSSVGQQRTLQPNENLWSCHGLVDRPPSSNWTVTTLMLRNLHGRLTQEGVMQCWPTAGLNYNLFYMPYDVTRNRTAGYAFINFLTPQAAAAFRDSWHGQPAPWSSSDGGSNDQRHLIEVRPAVRQGFDENVEYWTKTLSRFVDDSNSPAVFLGERRYAFWFFVRCMEHTNCQRAADMSIAPIAMSF